MAESKWSDPAFHEKLRHSSDERADAVAREVLEGKDGQANARRVSEIFRTMTVSDEPLPADLPEPVKRFFEETRALPSGIDLEKIARAEGIFMRHAFTASLVLLAKALPEGYSAPTFGKILNLSQDLDRHPYRRLLGVLQMVVNVCSDRGFEHGGSVVVTAQKLRLMHAAIRVHIVPRYLPDFEKKWGRPISMLDMLATIMGFSYLVIDGLRKLEVGLEESEAEDYYYLWSVFAQLMGIHPDGAPESFDYVPRTLADARAFYETYSKLNYVPASENPEGVRLAQANVKMLEDMVPRYLRILRLQAAPRIFTWELVGPEGCARVGIAPVRGHWILKALLNASLQLSHDTARKVPSHVAERLSRVIFRDMIHRSWGGDVTFLLPDTLADVRKLA
jgi:hypothetical protein